MTDVSLGTLSPNTTLASGMSVLTAKPSTVDPTKLTFALLQPAALLASGSTTSATSTAITSIVADEAGVLTITFANGAITSYGATNIIAPAPTLPAGVTPHSLSVINVAPNTIWPNVATALLGLSDGGRINVAAGLYKSVAHVDRATFPSGVTIVGAGAYLTVMDGQYGVGNGHRLSFGKGIIHSDANLTISNCGFIRGGKGDNVSDKESGIYIEGVSTSMISGCAFNDCETGVGSSPGAGTLTINNCEYGKNITNSLTDGQSHDNYIEHDTLIYTNNRHWGNQYGHDLKVRNCKNLSTSGNWLAHGGGRCVDVTTGTLTTWTSNNDVFTDVSGASTNYIGYADESTSSGTAGATFTNARFIIARYQSVIWNNTTGGNLVFTSPTIQWFKRDAVDPSMILQGPGTITGFSPLTPPSFVADPGPPTSTL